MNSNHVIDVYDRIAEEYARRYDPIESEDDLVFLNAFLGYVRPGEWIADIGCGTGYSTGYFVKHGMKAEGVDLSKNMIAIARRNYPNISFKVEDLRTYKPKGIVDAVWAGYCLFHLTKDDFEQVLVRIRSYLKPGGVFGLVMQEGSGESEIDEPLLPGEKIYVRAYTEAELEDLLKRSGFTIVDRRRKPPLYEMEYRYDKLLLIAQ